MQRVLVVGAGIAGLMVVRYLKKLGHEVTVIEKSDQVRAGGAGLMLGINAMKVLGELGLDQEVITQGQSLRSMTVVDERGRALAVADSRYMEMKTGYKTVAIHRGNLHEILLDETTSSTILTNTVVCEFQYEGNGVSVTLSNGDKKFFDIVVAADGINPSTKTLLKMRSSLRYAGYTCWRFVLDRPVGVEKDQGYEYWGKGCRFGVVPLGGNKLYCFATLNARENAFSNRRISLSDFKSIYSSVGGVVPEILATLATKDELIQSDIRDQQEVCFRYGNIVFVGDASHAATPNMGQGAAMAMEDASVLYQALLTEPSINEGLNQYEDRRKPRVKNIRDRSYRLGKVAQWESGIGRGLRNNILRLIPAHALSKDMCRLLLNC